VAYAPANLPPEKSCLVAVVQEAEWFPEPAWTFWRREFVFHNMMYIVLVLTEEWPVEHTYILLFWSVHFRRFRIHEKRLLAS